MIRLLLNNIKYILFLLLFVFALFGFRFNNIPNQKKLQDTTAAVITIDTVNFSAVGDLMCHSTQFNYARVAKDTFDFTGVYKPIKYVFERSDFVMGNMETAFAGKNERYSGYPIFNTPDDFLDGVKFAGFDMLFTANNHSMDKGEKGVLRTLEEIAKRNMFALGTYTGDEDRDSIRVYDIKGLKVAIIAYSYSNNGMPVPAGKDYLLNIIKESVIKKDLKNAKYLNPDLIMVYYHFGVEYKQEPNKWQENIVKISVENGADIILASHPHCMQPIEFFETTDGRIDSGFVAYSMGNFVSNQRWRYSDCGVILDFDIIKHSASDTLTLGDVSIMPTWVYKGNTGEKNEYIIYPSDISLSSFYPHFFNEEDKKLMKESYYDTKKILTSRSPRVKMRNSHYRVIFDITTKMLEKH